MNTIKVEWFDRGTDRIENQTFATVLEAVEFGQAVRNRDPLGEFLVGDLIPYIVADNGDVYELVKL